MRMMRFVSQHYGTYEFPDQSSGSMAFGDIVTSTQRMAGMDGTFDEYGDARAPQSGGNVQSTWWINPADRAKITGLKDAALKMQAFGRGRLFIKPEACPDERRRIRWAKARVNNINMSENVRDVPHLRQKVSGSFQVNQSGWYGCEPSSIEEAWNTNGWYYFDTPNLKWDTTGMTWGGPRYSANVSNGSTIQVQNSGSRPTLPIIRIGAKGQPWLIGEPGLMMGDGHTLDTVGLPFRRFGMRRLLGDSKIVVDEWYWSGEIAANEILVIDCQKNTLVWETASGDVSGFGNWEVRKGRGFFEIPPGTHTWEVFGEFDDTAYVDVEFDDSWY
jgi:hypothetical protein